MYGYVIALLLSNTFYYSFGYPVNETYGTLGKSLQLLANHCGNAFLSTQITNKLDTCNISLSSDREITETELECLIFYDINSQLCLALQGSNLDLSQSYSSRINGALKVETTCEASRNWKISNLSEYPKYYNTSERVFKTTVTCMKACGVDDLLSEDTNFFCKYYHWGSELLQAQATSTPLVSNVASEESGHAMVEVVSKAEQISAVPTTTNKEDGSKLQVSNDKQQQSHDTQVQVEPPKSQGHEGSITNVSPSLNAQSNNKEMTLPKSKLPEQPAAVPDVSTATKNEIEKPILAQDVPAKKKSDNELAKAEEAPSADPEDDENVDPEDDGLQDSPQSNDGNDPALDSDPKLDGEKKPQKNVASIVSSINVEMSQREFYSNTMQDTFNEDDDHFFSFFLTAIILVIFLYVLYHNKNKFRKLFLGLLVEGRQPGRRRNSRGHEYRRLDTLEQAMNTNSTAPPSKIIY